MADIFKQAAATLKSLAAAKEQHDRELRAEFDADFDGRREAYLARLEATRLRRLARLPADFVCPSCARKKIKSKEWNIAKIPYGNTVICRSCLAAQHEYSGLDLPDISELPERLRDMRRALGVSAKDFGYYCGWSATYQSRLERAGKTDKLAKIIKTVKFLMSLPYRT